MARTRAEGNGKARRLDTQQSVNSAIWAICDIMRRSNCAGAMQYVPELSWILFLRILDEREAREAEEAEAVGLAYTPSIEAPYRWRDWAAPFDDTLFSKTSAKEEHLQGWKRQELTSTKIGRLFEFINGVYNPDTKRVEGLIPYLKGLKDRLGASPRQRVISEILSGIEKVRVDTERNLQDILDKIHEIHDESVDSTHVFPLSQVFEGLLLKMGEKANDGGQFFTPREVIRTMVRVVDPRPGETVYDPGCGTGGFLAQAYEHMQAKLTAGTTGDQVEALKHRTFYGREKDNLIYPVALANLVLHGIDQPNLWHGNTLTGGEVYGGLFEGAPSQFRVILSNPPFGGKEGKDAQGAFAYKTSATQVLFLQHVIEALEAEGRCGIVLDEGVLFRTNETAFVKTKTKLLNDCDLWCIVSLPGGVFSAAGAGVKTNLLFFTKGKRTERIWYYDLSDIKAGKKTPFTLDHFKDFFALLPTRGDSDRSWTVDLAARRHAARQQSAPLRAEAEAKSREAQTLRDRVKELRRVVPVDAEEIAALEDGAAALTKTANELTGKADSIDAAVYDLKAVNPNTKAVEDTRTPEELLDLIEAKGIEVTEALAALRASLER